MECASWLNSTIRFRRIDGRPGLPISRSPAGAGARFWLLGYTFPVGDDMNRLRANVDSERLAEICRRWGIRELALFGSALRDDFGPDSDVDLLVDFEPGKVLGFKIFELERELSRLFGGRRIDLVPRKFLHPRLRQRVLAEAQIQYAA